MNLLGGSERGSWGEYSTQGGGGGTRRSRPESLGDGGAIRVPPERSSGKREGENEKGAAWAGSV
jgi:hypothetical protein